MARAVWKFFTSNISEKNDAGRREDRQDDLDKLAGFMTGSPIRSVEFVEAGALMRLVNDSIARRREFRLAEIDGLLFGNKIIAE